MLTPYFQCDLQDSLNQTKLIDKKTLHDQITPGDMPCISLCHPACTCAGRKPFRDFMLVSDTVPRNLEMSAMTIPLTYAMTSPHRGKNRVAQSILIRHALPSNKNALSSFCLADQSAWLPKRVSPG